MFEKTADVYIAYMPFDRTLYFIRDRTLADGVKLWRERNDISILDKMFDVELKVMHVQSSCLANAGDHTWRH